MASGFKQYPFSEIEKKWQDFWVQNKTFKTPDPAGENAKKPKYYILDMFPYPSGSGLHVGHLEGYTATDILARYKRMCGFNVMHPIGWDAFGLPAEQYAIETGTHPRVTTEKNINTFRRQIQRIGFSYDWDREVNTTDPNYYKWTQWIFTKLYEKGLAYEAEISVNWCPALGTVLANEEVVDGKSERGGHPVIRKPMRQWVLKITAYAERLLEDLELLDWPESIKEMQRNWIGKSTGAEVDFQVEDSGVKIKVYTTRPDTLFGATYLVLSPEHELVSKITKSSQKEAVEEYQAAAQRKSDLERTDLAKTKTGVFTGAYAINPVNQKQIPVWIADYVLASYGTGAIMAVPAHDERDHEFAKKFSLPIVAVIKKSDGTETDVQSSAFTEEGINCGSGFIDGLKTSEAKQKMTRWLEEKGVGKKQVQYKLRDWLFSRQRYWGEPFPVVHVDGQAQLVSEKELPVKLPEVESYKPTGTGESPLAGIAEWVNVSVNGKSAKRETNTMPQWAGSCWYYLRYLDPNNSEKLIDPVKEKYWMPVDLYVGGAEHAVLHLLYSRFWHKVLFDLGVVSTKEPFQRLTNQGMILGEDGQKMSKSRGNVANPEEIMDAYGADSVRLYEMFMGPLEMTKPWSTSGVEGVYRFLGKVWRLFMEQKDENSPFALSSKIVSLKPTKEHLRVLHAAIKKVTEDLEGMRFNTAISAMMVFVNEFGKFEARPREVLEKFLLLLAPFAPHLAEELWGKIGHTATLAYESWPRWDETVLKEDSVELAVLVGGKVKTKITVAVGESEEVIRKTALAQVKVQESMAGKTAKQIIIVPGRIVNIVLG